MGRKAPAPVYYIARTEWRGVTGKLIDYSRWARYHVGCKPAPRTASVNMGGMYTTEYKVLPVAVHNGDDKYCDQCGDLIRYR